MHKILTGMGWSNKWLQTMQKFASLVGNVIKIRDAAAAADSGNHATPQAAHAPRDYQNEVRVQGQVVLFRQRHDFDRQKVWYSSSTDHGTLMAALVRKIYPNASLYVARLDQTETERGVFQPALESAVKASRARRRYHHVRAASDQGAHNASSPYMAKLSKESTSPVICISGAREAGYGDKKAMSEAEFFFPGQTHGILEPLPHIKSNFGSQIGSSVATALATGLTALIRLLVNISPKYGGHTPSSPHAVVAGTTTTAGGGGSIPHITSPYPALSPTTASSSSSSSYRGMLQQPHNIRHVFYEMLRSPELLLSSRREPAEYSRTDSVIAVDRFFEHEGLKKRLDSYMGPDRSKRAARLFDRRLEMVLR
ncbi:hypothetical protein N658DRAFT_527311 [Parathielavia hyrcaniae]|uniref:Peptidase S8/S53 domain-containing protein n=1 Tax=Parathielavia hyrcaniae TaxID=113614 RepID=A0AAN6PUU9_9PEZI|nr:hypothetical protein N658DRAFT_527311 [Parathielavia hyrcaniae]